MFLKIPASIYLLESIKLGVFLLPVWLGYFPDPVRFKRFPLSRVFTLFSLLVEIYKREFISTLLVELIFSNPSPEFPYNSFMLTAILSHVTTRTLILQFLGRL